VFGGLACRRLMMLVLSNAGGRAFGLFLKAFQAILAGLPGSQTESSHAFAAFMEDQPLKL
jgi:hypothetical protein